RAGSGRWSAASGAPRPARNAAGRVAPARRPRAQARAYAAARTPAPSRTSAWTSPEVQANGGGAGEACTAIFVAGAAGPAQSVGGVPWARRGAVRQPPLPPVIGRTRGRRPSAAGARSRG